MPTFSNGQNIQAENQQGNRGVEQHYTPNGFETFTEYSTQHQHNTHSSQVHREHSPGQITCQVNKTSLNKFKETEIIPSIFPDRRNEAINQQQKENWKIHKQVELKQHTPEQSMDQRNPKYLEKDVN